MMKLSSGKIFNKHKESNENTNAQQEQPLLKALIDGDEQAFEQVYKALFTHLHNYSSSIIKDSETAYDIVQNIFIALWENKKKLDPNKSLRNYLLCCTHNNSLRHLQRVALHNRHQVNIKREKKAEELENVIVYQENITTKRVTALLDKLPKRSRQITIMSRIEGKKNRDIATSLDISVRTVETILYQSMKKLRGLVKD